MGSIKVTKMTSHDHNFKQIPWCGMKLLGLFLPLLSNSALFTWNTVHMALVLMHDIMTVFYSSRNQGW